MLVLENGGTPEALSTVIAAAIYYDNTDDPIAQILTALVKEEGIEYVLDSICKLSDQKELKKLIVQKVSMLKERGWIKEK
jgi:mannitol-1-phosphate 5-dehydrogenase